MKDVISLRVTPAEKAELERLAQLQGMTLTDYVRQRMGLFVGLTHQVYGMTYTWNQATGALIQWRCHCGKQLNLGESCQH